jgi:hypothetical protein
MNKSSLIWCKYEDDYKQLFDTPLNNKQFCCRNLLLNTQFVLSYAVLFYKYTRLMLNRKWVICICNLCDCWLNSNEIDKTIYYPKYFDNLWIDMKNCLLEEIFVSSPSLKIILHQMKFCHIDIIYGTRNNTRVGSNVIEFLSRFVQLFWTEMIIYQDV